MPPVPAPEHVAGSPAASMISVLAWAVPLVGIALYAAAVPAFRAALARLAQRVRTYFFGPATSLAASEAVSAPVDQSPQTPPARRDARRDDRAALVESFDMSIFDEPDAG